MGNSPNPPPEFAPVPLRRRRDGWTPERQFAYVLALAELGHCGRAARAVGMSAQSACRLRRRPGARAFRRLCEAARGFAARRRAGERAARLRGLGGSAFPLPGEAELSELYETSGRPDRAAAPRSAPAADPSPPRRVLRPDGRLTMAMMELHRGRLVDHIQLVVADLAASRRFYEAVMGALGIPLGGSAESHFWYDELFVSTPDGPEAAGTLTGRHHLAFQAGDRGAVDAFHAAGLAAGGRDNGAPGERANYHPGYYAAFLLDPDGNNVEAVHHGEAERSAPSVKIEF